MGTGATWSTTASSLDQCQAVERCGKHAMGSALHSCRYRQVFRKTLSPARRMEARILPGAPGAQFPAERHEGLRWACSCGIAAVRAEEGRLVRLLLAQTPPGAHSKLLRPLPGGKGLTKAVSCMCNVLHPPKYGQVCQKTLSPARRTKA